VSELEALLWLIYACREYRCGGRGGGEKGSEQWACCKRPLLHRLEGPGVELEALLADIYAREYRCVGGRGGSGEKALSSAEATPCKKRPCPPASTWRGTSVELEALLADLCTGVQVGGGGEGEKKALSSALGA
jgi:hypothetical protein